ncbi:MAG: dihydropyrimidinase [Bacteroidales bacterium]|nr:dihydropyrimidinase [Bacteroidales bacterium]
MQNSSMKLLIKNAKLVLAEKILEADLLIDEGKIAKIDTQINATNTAVLNAHGKYILPGGIDPHVHLALSTPNGFSADDFETGSRAALAGGTTTFIDFITPKKGQNLIEAYHQRLAEVKLCACDYAFHMSIIEWRKGIQEEMEACVKECGINSFKTYLAYQETIGIQFDELEKVMQVAKLLNAMVTIHAEMGDTIDQLRTKALKYKQVDSIYHAKTRPDYTEYQAIEKIIELVRKTKCRTYIVHVSTAESLNKIAQAQNEKLPIFAETCPQYFTFNASVYQKADPENLGFIMSPPIRTEENRLGIEKHISLGTVSTLGTDHCPFTLAQKQKGTNFAEIPNGAGGIQERLSIFYSRFVHNKQLTFNAMASLIAKNAAALFQLPNKGEIAVGFDADLVVWEEKAQKVKDQKLYSSGDLIIYANEIIQGKTDIVIKNGEIVYQNGILKTDLAGGRYIFRK